MKVDKQTALKVWEAYFGRRAEVYDAFGVLINKVEHGTSSNKAWDIDHIWPENSENEEWDGANTYSNVQPLAIVSNQEKGNKLQGKVNGIPFAVKKIDENEGLAIGRMKIELNGEWYWAYDEPEY